jgi:phosphonate transport system substrate-binding protein
MRFRINLLFVLSIMIIPVMLVSGCQKEFSSRPGPTTTPLSTKTPTPYLSPTPSPTLYPTNTPTPEPLGGPANPVVIGFIQSAEDNLFIEAKNQFATDLSNLTKLSIQIQVFDNYQAFELAALNNQVHIAWLDPIEYILASKNHQMKAALVSYHLGVKAYGVQILANSTSPFTPYFDPKINKSTADNITAFAQFSGTRPCFSPSTSLTGNLIPHGLFSQAGVPLSDPVITYSTSANIRAVYITGICDFTATYAISGDPRTSTELISAIPDILEKVEIIWRSDGIIPNLAVAYSPMVDLPMASIITEALITYGRSPEGQTILASANDYQIEGLEKIEDTDYDYLRYLLQVQNVDLYSLLDPD